MASDRPVGELLREWRHHAMLSQLDLAIRAQVSARHVSFVETGRPAPSRSMHRTWPPAARRSRRCCAAIAQVLRGHEPYPAIAVDRSWNLALANRAVDVVLEGIDPELLVPPVNVMRLGLHPQGFRPTLRCPSGPPTAAPSSRSSALSRTFGAAFDITLDEIAIEAYFPANAETAAALQASAG